MFKTEQMKEIITILIAIALIPALFAQDTEKGDKKSREILDKVSQKTEAYKSFKAEFTYKMQNKEAGIDESKDGVLVVSGDKYNLEIAGQEIICDGETVWTYIEDADEVQINTVEDNDESITPNNLFSSYQKDYKSKFVKETFQYGTDVYVIDMTPNEGKNFSKVRIIIDKDKLEILDFTIFDNSGSSYSYVINKFTPDVEIKDSDFTFDTADYPDLEVVDMR